MIKVQELGKSFDGRFVLSRLSFQAFDGAITGLLGANGDGLFILQIVFVLGWVYRNSPAHRQPLSTWLFFGSLPIDVVWMCTLGFFGFLVWFRRRKRAEWASLIRLRERMTEAETGLAGWPAKQPKN